MAVSESEKLELDRVRRVDLARKAFKEYFALCFWSSNPNMEIHEEHIPFVIRGLRHYGGHTGYRVAPAVFRSGLLSTKCFRFLRTNPTLASTWAGRPVFLKPPTPPG